MELLKEIMRSPGVPCAGKTISREAVRGIIARGNALLLLYSTELRDYKFPGGGVQAGETHRQALLREIREETGADMTGIELPFGKVIEYDVPKERGYDVFRMTSYYYWCQVGPIFSEQRLDDYEKDLGFQPAWVEIGEALRVNQAILRAGPRSTYQWLARETFVLEQIQQHDFQGQHGQTLR